MLRVHNCDTLTGVSGSHDGLETYGYNLQKSTAFDSVTVAIRKNEIIPVTFTPQVTINAVNADYQVIAWAASSVPHLADVQSLQVNGSGGSTTAADVKADMVGWFTPFAFACPSATIGTSITSVVWSWDASGQNVRTANNIWMDMIVAGDGVDINGTTVSDQLFTEAQAFDESSNAYNGVLTELSGIIYAQSNIFISATQGHSYGETLVFYETTFGNNDYTLEGTGDLDLQGTNILTSGAITLTLDFSSLSACSVQGGSIQGYATLSTTTGQTYDGVVFKDGGTATFSSNIDNSTFDTCGTVTISGAAVATNCVFQNSDAASSVVVADLADLAQCRFVSDGSNNGVELTSLGSGSMTWDNKLTGYSGTAGNAGLFVNVGSGTLDISVSAFGDTPTIRTAGATVNIVVSTTLELTGLVAGSEVRVFEAGTTTEVAGVESSGTTYSTPITVSSVDISILSLGYQNIRLKAQATNVDRSIPIQQVVDRQYSA